MPVGQPKTGGSWSRDLTECCPLEKGMANHFSILALRTPWTIWKGKMIGYWSGLPFPSPVSHILSDLSTMTRPSWVAPRAWLSFIELDKAVVLVWLDWLVFCEYGFNVFALWCPLATSTILLGFLLPWTWGISSQLLQQRRHQMVNTEIRLIIFFAAKDGEALYSQQKQDQELTVAQTMNSLLPNSDLNWRK